MVWGFSTEIVMLISGGSCYNPVFKLRRQKTLCDFLQRIVANFGNDEGTKTNKNKSTAETKLTKYQIQLGKALGARNIEKNR